MCKQVCGGYCPWQKNAPCVYMYIRTKQVFCFPRMLTSVILVLARTFFKTRKLQKAKYRFYQTVDYQNFTKEKKIKNRIYDVTNIAFLIVPL